jgi:branched-chain amino acid:cation transporter, LIVCS family
MSKTLSAGIAMFAMLFGAGNVVFSLALGRDMGDMVWWAIGGFCLTAVLVPLLGLISTILYDGDYNAFLGRIGVIPGALVAFACLILIGPFGAIPRCITTSYAAVKWYFPNFTLLYFSAIAALIIFLFTFRQNNVVDLIGRFLGPLKLTLLLSIIIVGLFWMNGMPAAIEIAPSSALLKGVVEGYGTMDLLGTIFFAGLIFGSLKKDMDPANLDYKLLAIQGFKAGLIGAFLLTIVYTGFCLVASFHGPSVADVDRYELLNALAPFILGPHGGMLTNAAVAISCLVTAIALTTVFAEYLHRVILRKHVSYVAALLITVISSGLMTNLGFKGIMGFIAPMVIAFYPAMVVLALFNLGYKLFGIKAVRVPVFATFAVTLIVQFVA